MSTAAQDEFDALCLNDQSSGLNGHPEDRHHSESSENESSDEEKTLTSDRSPAMPTATSTHLPRTHFDANTGPKGVIADAQSFETAKKRTFRQTLYAFSNGFTKPGSPERKWREKSKSPSPDISADEEEDDFMRRWRANRLDELASNQHITRTRRHSPSQRRYGSLGTVDPLGYLDAVEKVPAYTIVVVLIYDDQSALSGQVEDSLKVLARTHDTVRFVKLHFLDAEMDEIAAPGILAYKGGECFANLVSVIDEIPSGKDISSTTLEQVLQSYRVLM